MREAITENFTEHQREKASGQRLSVQILACGASAKNSPVLGHHGVAHCSSFMDELRAEDKLLLY